MKEFCRKILFRKNIDDLFKLWVLRVCPFVIKFLTITLSFYKIRSMNLKEYRTKNNLSAIKLASILGISRQHVYELEKPEHKPSVKLAKKIETLLNREVTAVELLGIN